MRHLIVNFGGPRSLEEIPEFLIELLCDQEVVRTKLPKSLHRFFFTKIAKKRAEKIKEDYEEIGGKSPIYESTQAIADKIRNRLHHPLTTFHRYLPKTHGKTLEILENCSEKTILVFPLFPQFSYATTGSIAQFFEKHLSEKTCAKLRWIRSYAQHPCFVESYQKKIRSFLQTHGLEEKDVVLFFSPHGIPKKFVKTNDPYETQCQQSYHAIIKAFPNAVCKLCYQSKFGPGKWLTPYTEQAAKSILSWNQKRKYVLFIPLSFTSDHIETLFEIEKLYLPLVKEQGLYAYRLDALNLEEYWVNGICHLLQNTNVEKETYINNFLLRRPNRKTFCNSRK